MIDKDKKDKKSYFYNIENVKSKTEFLEQQIKLKEKSLKYTGGIEKNPEECDRLLNFKIEAIKAKLAVLDNIDK